MDMLDFAIYVLPPYIVAVFLFGVAYRLSRCVFLWKRKPRAPRRRRPLISLLTGLVMTFLDPIIIGAKKRTSDFIGGLIALHILGVIPLIFLLGQHVAVFSYWIPFYSILKPLAIPSSITTGSQSFFTNVIPASEMSGTFVNTLWGPLTIILNGDLLAILAMIGVSYKLGDKSVRAIHKLPHIRLGDFFDLALLLAILVSGFMATHHLPSPDVATYRLVLGTHILLAETLAALLPFTKFWHFVFGYWFGKLHEWYDIRLNRGAL
jgi:nitrate reductase gamma subunit